MTQFDEVYSKVCEMLCDAKDLELDDLDPDMPLHKLKLDSLDYVELTLRELCQYLSEKSH